MKKGFSRSFEVLIFFVVRILKTSNAYKWDVYLCLYYGTTVMNTVLFPAQRLLDINLTIIHVTNNMLLQSSVTQNLNKYVLWLINTLFSRIN